jgi:glycosyltransferase
MPPHPTFFARRQLFERYGAFDLSYPIAADYELMLRLLYKHRISVAYIPEVLVKMRTGGKSAPSLKTAWKVFRENHNAWSSNRLNTSLSTFVLKPLLKTVQYVQPLSEP